LVIPLRKIFRTRRKFEFRHGANALDIVSRRKSKVESL